MIKSLPLSAVFLPQPQVHKCLALRVREGESPCRCPIVKACSPFQNIVYDPPNEKAFSLHGYATTLHIRPAVQVGHFFSPKKFQRTVRAMVFPFYLTGRIALFALLDEIEHSTWSK
jgi:hypothetical protein